MTLARGEDSRAEFCRREHPRLLASLALYTGDADLAEELAQEALARAYLHWPRVERMDEPGAWTHRVALNLANSHFRRRRYERAAKARASAVRPSGAHGQPDGDISDVVRLALMGLPRRQREAVLLRYLLDLSVETTARRMDCAPGTVRALTSQALARLRDHPALADVEENADA